MKYGNCKFGTYCRFRHVLVDNPSDEEVKKKLESSFKQCQKGNKEGNKIKDLNQILNEKCCQIEKLIVKLWILEIR